MHRTWSELCIVIVIVIVIILFIISKIKIVTLTLQLRAQEIPAPPRAAGGSMGSFREYSSSVETGQVTAMFLQCGPSLVTAGRALKPGQAARKGSDAEVRLVAMVTEHKPELQKSTDFQKNAVEQYNPDIDKDTSMMYLKMSLPVMVNTMTMSLSA